MRRELEGKALPGVTVKEASAEDLRGANVPEEWADGVVVAQAFHWFATEQALGEIHRVLKPGGVLGMIWNIDDCGLFFSLLHLPFSLSPPHVHTHTQRQQPLWSLTTCNRSPY